VVAAEVEQRAGLSARPAVLLTVAIVALWAAVAAIRPGTTFHLAPVIVALAYPYARWPQTRTRRSRFVAGLIGTCGALLGTVLLQAAGLLEGPTLLGANPLHESVAAAVAAGAVTAVVAAARITDALTEGSQRRPPGR